MLRRARYCPHPSRRSDRMIRVISESRRSVTGLSLEYEHLRAAARTGFGTRPAAGHGTAVSSWHRVGESQDDPIMVHTILKCMIHSEQQHSNESLFIPEIKQLLEYRWQGPPKRAMADIRHHGLSHERENNKLTKL
eukprot:759574-Hanusia_phi.AAC.4